MNLSLVFSYATGIFTGEAHSQDNVLLPEGFGFWPSDGIDWSAQKIDLALLATRQAALDAAQAALDAAADDKEREAARAQLEAAVALPVVLDYIPPAPDDDEDGTHEWDVTAKRWQRQATLEAKKKARKAPIKSQINAIEATQHEPTRNYMLAIAGGKTGAVHVARLQEIDGAIELLKAKIAAITACETEAELNDITWP